MLNGVVIKPRILKMFKWNVHKIRMYNIPLSRRLFGTKQSIVDSSKEFQKFKWRQAKMQCDDGLPVFLKCGTRDKIVVCALAGVVFINLILSFYTFIQAEYRYYRPKRS